MAGGNKSKKNNSKNKKASKASSTSASPISGTKTSTISKGKQPATSPISKVTPQGCPSIPSSSSTAHNREKDSLMPISNVNRVMRRILPSHAKISDEAKDTIQKSVSEFISFVTQEANEKCHREQRKIVTADDLISAMSTLGFKDYVDPLSTYLYKYRESEAVKHGEAIYLPIRRQIMASPKAMTMPSIAVGPNPSMNTAIATAPVSIIATTPPTTIATTIAPASANVFSTESYIGNYGDNGIDLINTACYDQFNVGSSYNNDYLSQIGDGFEMLSSMVAPPPSASNTGVYQDQYHTYDPFSQFK